MIGRTILVPLLGLAAMVTAPGCGEPTARLVSPPESRFTYEVPAEFTPISGDVGGQPTLAYGVEGSSLDQLGNDPILILVSAPSGDVSSFESLRLLATGGEFDPLDESLDPLPNDTELLGYVEYGAPDIWGIRIRLLVGPAIADFQALVDRRTDQIAVTELICTQACFTTQLDLIDEIQASWSLEP